MQCGADRRAVLAVGKDADGEDACAGHALKHTVTAPVAPVTYQAPKKRGVVFGPKAKDSLCAVPDTAVVNEIRAAVANLKPVISTGKVGGETVPTAEPEKEVMTRVSSTKLDRIKCEQPDCGREIARYQMSNHLRQAHGITPVGKPATEKPKPAKPNGHSVIPRSRYVDPLAHEKALLESLATLKMELEEEMQAIEAVESLLLRRIDHRKLATSVELPIDSNYLADTQ